MAVEQWVVMTKKADFQAMAEEFKISPMLARIIRNRDVISAEEVDYYLNATPEQMHAPEKMANMREGALLLLDSLRKKRRIRVIGDYDVDGICAAYILKRGLSEFGADVSVAIPHRVKDGYGLNRRLIEEAYEAGVDVIVTCDNGIAAGEETALAKSMGMKVIVTDHHEVPYEEGTDGRVEILPPADVIINPKQEACNYPFPDICGALIAYKLVEMLCTVAEHDGRKMLRELLEFAAIATVCDVMDLLDENRIVVKYGLSYMKKSANPGLRTLIEVCGLVGGNIGSYHVGFVIGPCLNATGRLDSAMKALGLFEAEDETKALPIALWLRDMNESRKQMTEKGLQEAMVQVEECGYKEQNVLVVYLKNCHESIAGIIAGRLKEEYYKPVFVLTDGEEGLKGSGRSIEAYSMYEGLSGVKDLLERFGGHRMAAGFSLKAENLEEFRRRINENADLREEDFVRKIRIDIPMPISYATGAFVDELARLEPFGNGNHKPLFAQKNVKIRNCTVRGKNKNVAGFILEDENGYRVNGVYFGDAQAFLEELKARGERVNIVYYPEVNEFRGNVTLQMVVSHYMFQDS